MATTPPTAMMAGSLASCAGLFLPRASLRGGRRALGFAGEGAVGPQGAADDRTGRDPGSLPVHAIEALGGDGGLGVAAGHRPVVLFLIGCFADARDGRSVQPPSLHVEFLCHVPVPSSKRAVPQRQCVCSSHRKSRQPANPGCSLPAPPQVCGGFPGSKPSQSMPPAGRARVHLTGHPYLCKREYWLVVPRSDEWDVRARWTMRAEGKPEAPCSQDGHRRRKDRSMLFPGAENADGSLAPWAAPSPELVTGSRSRLAEPYCWIIVSNCCARRGFRSRRIRCCSSASAGSPRRR